MKIKHNVHGWIDGKGTDGEMVYFAHDGDYENGVLTGHGGHVGIYKIVSADDLKVNSER